MHAQFLQKYVHARANGLVVNVEQADVPSPSALPILRGGSPSWLFLGYGGTPQIGTLHFLRTQKTAAGAAFIRYSRTEALNSSSMAS